MSASSSSLACAWRRFDASSPAVGREGESSSAATWFDPAVSTGAADAELSATDRVCDGLELNCRERNRPPHKRATTVKAMPGLVTSAILSRLENVTECEAAVVNAALETVARRLAGTEAAASVE